MTEPSETKSVTIFVFIVYVKGVDFFCSHDDFCLDVLMQFCFGTFFFDFHRKLFQIIASILLGAHKNVQNLKSEEKQENVEENVLMYNINKFIFMSIQL